MLGSPEKRNPAAGNGRALEKDRAGRPISLQDSPSLRDLQARHLSARFALTPPVAGLIAERAFAVIEEAR